MSLRVLTKLQPGSALHLHGSLLPEAPTQWLERILVNGSNNFSDVEQRRQAHGSPMAPQASAKDPADIVLRKAFAHCVRNTRRALFCHINNWLDRILERWPAHQQCCWTSWRLFLVTTKFLLCRESDYENYVWAVQLPKVCQACMAYGIPHQSAIWR